MPRPLKWGILGTSTIILSKDIDEHAFMCGSNFYETAVNWTKRGILVGIPTWIVLKILLPSAQQTKILTGKVEKQRDVFYSAWQPGIFTKTA